MEDTCNGERASKVPPRGRSGCFSFGFRARAGEAALGLPPLFLLECTAPAVLGISPAENSCSSFMGFGWSDVAQRSPTSVGLGLSMKTASEIITDRTKHVALISVQCCKSRDECVHECVQVVGKFHLSEKNKRARVHFCCGEPQHNGQNPDPKCSQAILQNFACRWTSTVPEIKFHESKYKLSALEKGCYPM